MEVCVKILAVQVGPSSFLLFYFISPRKSHHRWRESLECSSSKLFYSSQCNRTIASLWSSKWMCSKFKSLAVVNKTCLISGSEGNIYTYEDSSFTTTDLILDHHMFPCKCAFFWVVKVSYSKRKSLRTWEHEHFQVSSMTFKVSFYFSSLQNTNKRVKFHVFHK